MAKKTMVMLTNDALGVSKEYEVSHAERILRMPNNGGWHLPENSNYQFDKEYGIRPKRDKGRDIEESEKIDD